MRGPCPEPPAPWLPTLNPWDAPRASSMDAATGSCNTLTAHPSSLATAPPKPSLSLEEVGAALTARLKAQLAETEADEPACKAGKQVEDYMTRKLGFLPGAAAQSNNANSSVASNQLDKEFSKLLLSLGYMDTSSALLKDGSACRQCVQFFASLASKREPPAHSWNLDSANPDALDVRKAGHFRLRMLTGSSGRPWYMLYPRNPYKARIHLLVIPDAITALWILWSKLGPSLADTVRELVNTGMRFLLRRTKVFNPDCLPPPHPRLFQGPVIRPSGWKMGVDDYVFYRQLCKYLLLKTPCGCAALEAGGILAHIALEVGVGKEEVLTGPVDCELDRLSYCPLKYTSRALVADKLSPDEVHAICGLFLAETTSSKQGRQRGSLSHSKEVRQTVKVLVYPLPNMWLKSPSNFVDWTPQNEHNYLNWRKGYDVGNFKSAVSPQEWKNQLCGNRDWDRAHAYVALRAEELLNGVVP